MGREHNSWRGWGVWGREEGRGRGVGRVQDRYTVGKNPLDGFGTLPWGSRAPHPAPRLPTRRSLHSSFYSNCISKSESVVKQSWGGKDFTMNSDWGNFLGQWTSSDTGCGGSTTCTP